MYATCFLGVLMSKFKYTLKEKFFNPHYSWALEF